MRLTESFSPRKLCARWGFIVTLAALAAPTGGMGCTASAAAGAQSQPPEPGLVAIGPEVWVEGQPDAPDAYYTGGYYWRYEDDHWYRRPRPTDTWVIVETRVVPERVIVHERDHHAAIVARHPPSAERVAAERAREHEKIDERRDAANEHREQVREQQQEKTADIRERKEEKVSQERETDAKRREQAADRREKSAEAAEHREEQRDQSAEQRQAERERQQRAEEAERARQKK